jgi:hypothetical protein
MKNINIVSACLILAVILLSVAIGMLYQKQSIKQSAYQDKIIQLDEQIKALQNLEQTAKNTLNNIAGINQKAIGIDAQLTTNTLGMQVDSGKVKIDLNNVPEIANPQGCDGKRGVLNKQVNFQRKFVSAPKVMLGFSAVDFRFGQDNRLKAMVTEVTNTHFNLDFHTWCDTKMSLAEINWIAIGS